ncbi:BON domain-containing protein [Paraburkholderia adhaesiva]|uniref:BON domain-containing protein n=1 Tax=Paraburkholderia adhaesiva TaxID=2883244 RepID=UPI001F279216|nr:BON domain-containing protein [Paraburkholderia adhaesiva]
MKTAFASSLALAISCSIVPTAHADSSLANQIYRAMGNNGVTTSHMFVLTQGGDVTLVGRLPELRQVQLADEAAHSVPGVTSVNNQLTGLGGGRTGSSAGSH